MDRTAEHTLPADFNQIEFDLTDDERRAARDAYDNWVLTRAFEDR